MRRLLQFLSRLRALNFDRRIAKSRSRPSGPPAGQRQTTVVAPRSTPARAAAVTPPASPATQTPEPDGFIERRRVMRAAQPSPTARPSVSEPRAPQAPPLEFGGLIERRKVSRAPSAADSTAATWQTPRARTPATEKSWGSRHDAESADRSADAAATSTGADTDGFLRSLDNSAITLVDTSQFEVEDETVEETTKPRGFNPYDRDP